MPSVKPAPQLVALALCGVIGAGSLAGCSTTQEKAAVQRAESEQILEAREKRQQKKRQQPQHGKEKG